MKKLFALGNLIFLLNSVFGSFLVINKIFPNPEGKDLAKEWLQIYNESLNSVDLYGYKIKDKAGKIFEIKRHYLLRPKESFIIFPNPKLRINNQGEILYLMNPKGEILDKVVLEEVCEGMALCRQDDKWRICPAFERKTKKVLKKEKIEDKNFYKNNDFSYKFFGFGVGVSAILAFFLARKLCFLDFS